MGVNDRIDEMMMLELPRLRAEIAKLKADAIVVAHGIDALQNSGGLPSDDFEGCIE